VIEVDRLTKRYGAFTAVDDISFQVGKGEIVGFLGPNGAGKTTTMRVLTCFLPATEGTARIAGYDIFDNPLEVKKRIGYLPELPPLYRDMRVRTYLEFIAKIKGVAPKESRQRIDEAIAQCGLVDRTEQLIGHLSKGYRQRVGLAQAILHDPEVIIMDEPTSGLDPNQIIEVRQLIRELAQERTVILSTHILPEVEMTCNRVIIIHEGKIVAVDTPENLTAHMRDTTRFFVRISGDIDIAAKAIATIDGVSDVTRANNGLHVHWPAEADLSAAVSARIVELGMGLVEMKREAMSLEEIFHALTMHEEEV
jgi:ABC-2 type transport system ATP-binding protein